jgi:hypothetical protein
MAQTLRTSLREWLRNALLGALLVSSRALLETLNSPRKGSLGLVLLLGGIGVLAGLGFTALKPIRRASRLGLYVTWILTVYVVIGGVIAAGVSAGDRTGLDSLQVPIGWIFWLVIGMVAGIFCARTHERWSSGDFR